MRKCLSKDKVQSLGALRFQAADGVVPPGMSRMLEKLQSQRAKGAQAGGSRKGMRAVLTPGGGRAVHPLRLRSRSGLDDPQALQRRLSSRLDAGVRRRPTSRTPFHHTSSTWSPRPPPSQS